MSEKILASLCFDKYICVSKNSESQLKSMNPRADINKQIVIYNGIDNALFTFHNGWNQNKGKFENNRIFYLYVIWSAGYF